MSPAPKYIINAYCNCETYDADVYEFSFRNTETVLLTIKRNSKFLHLKKRIETYLGSCSVSQITYQNPIYFENNQLKFYPLKVRDDEDAEYMFVSHKHYGFNSIELCITLQQTLPSQ